MKKNIFPSCQHIKYRKEFQHLFQHGFRIYGSFFICRFVFSQDSYSKLGVSTSKKFGNAVYRNRIKRCVREEFRHHYFPHSIQLLVSQYKPIVSTSLARKELKQVFNLLSDYYFLLQMSLDHTSLKTAQQSIRLSLGAKIMFYIVFYYKKYISSKLTPSCRYTPSCSLYSLEAYRVYGFVKGSFFTLKRILSCNPLGGKGYSPLPQKRKIKK